MGLEKLQSLEELCGVLRIGGFGDLQMQAGDIETISVQDAAEKAWKHILVQIVP